MQAPSRNTLDASVFNISDIAAPGAEEGKMTEPTRYLVRKGTRGWMVWDRHARKPASLEEGRPAVWLSEEQAQKIKDELLGLKANNK
jgi:hypothetical protein